MIKPSGLFVLALLIFAPYCYSQSSPSTATSRLNPAFSITVEAPMPPIRLGAPINITVTVTNISQEDIFWAAYKGKDSQYKAFTISLMKGGREVKPTLFNRRITGREEPDDPPGGQEQSSIALAHPPGKMFVMTIDLMRLYDITEPGLYALDVSRFDDYSKTTVRSKTLTLDIVR